MMILALESSASACSAALCRDGELIAQSYQNSGLTHSRTLLPMVHDMLKNCGHTLDEAEVIAVAAGPGSFTGVLTLAVCSVGLLCKRFTEAIDTLDFRAYHALEAMGTPKLSCVRHAALPQLVPQFFSAWLYRFDVNIREASALGLAGAGGIGAPLILALNQYAWHDVSTLALGMIALSWLVDLVSAFCRRRDA